MQFESWADLMAMSGHGPYVWSAFISGVLLLVANTWWAKYRYNKTKRELKALWRRQFMQESK